MDRQTEPVESGGPPFHPGGNIVTASTLKSEIKTSLEQQSSSSPVLSESEETSPVISEESQVSLTEPHSTSRDHGPLQPVLVAPVHPKSTDNKPVTAPPRSTQSKRPETVAASKKKTGTSAAAPPLKNSLPPLVGKLPTTARDQPSSGRQEQHRDRDDGGGHHLDKDTTDDVQHAGLQTLDSSSDLVDVTDSEMSMMSGLNFNTVEDVMKQRTTPQSRRLPSEEKNVRTVHDQGESGDVGDAGEGGEGGDAGEGGDSESVTLTELSGEEEIEEDLEDSGEDTMFEESPHQLGNTVFYLLVIIIY